MATLPERILAELELAPTYGLELSRRLGKPSGAVSQALTSLARRGLVEVIATEPAHHGDPRKIFAPIHAARSRRGRPATKPPTAVEHDLEVWRDRSDFSGGVGLLTALTERGLTRAAVPTAAALVAMLDHEARARRRRDPGSKVDPGSGVTHARDG